VRLATDIYRPDSPGRFPALVTRGPYGKDGYADNQEHSIWFFPQRGYVVVSQDCRARFDSEGDHFDPLFQEGQDGYDTVEWAARQPWCNGRVATTGQSYLGATQYTLAAGPRPPHLACMAPVSASADFHQSWVYHTGGAMEWGWMVAYAIHMGRNTLLRAGREDLLAQMDEYVLPPDNFAQPLTDAWFRHLPLRDWIGRLKETAPYFHEYFDQENDGPYWTPINLMRNAHKISLPMFHVSSWYDIFLEGALNGYQELRDRAATAEARRSQRLLIGPWAHIRPYTAPTSGDTGDIDFGPEARIELHEHLLRWFDYWLKGIDNGIVDEPPLRLFIMGINEWHDEHEWPLARTQWQKWYFHSNGKANSVLGDGELSTEAPAHEPTDHFVYDPHYPVQTIGGNNCCSPHIVPWGPYDQRPAEMRGDVLCYTTEPMAEDMEVTGPIKVVLYAATDGLDTDWTAKLVDVSPTGYAMNLCDGIIRARYRESFTDPTLLEPNTVYEYEIDVAVTGNVFRKGHCVRVEISSSNFPRFDRNPNTGNTLGIDAEMRSAQQTIYHTSQYPSHILLPAIPTK
jgi:putative CocE/NonD family hydrolase